MMKMAFGKSPSNFESKVWMWRQAPCDFFHSTAPPLLYWNESSEPVENPMLKILILEDDARRRAAMQDCLLDRFHQYESLFFDDAREMHAYLEQNLGAALI